MAFYNKRNFGDLLSMHDDIHRFFEDAFKGIPLIGDASASWYPVTDIYETKDEYVFKLEVPGLVKEDIDIQLKDNTLFIKGERKEDNEVKKENYHRIESFNGKFARNFALPKNVDIQKVNATLKEGILVLRIGKAEEQKAKAIAIDVK